LVAERNDLELQFYATAKPTAEPGEERVHAGDITADRNKSPAFSALSEFLSRDNWFREIRDRLSK